VATWTSFTAKLALAALSFVVAIGGAAAIVLYQHVQTRSVPVEAAAAELASARASAAAVSNRPMLEVSGQLQVLVRRDLSRGRHGFVALHWVDYDPFARKLVRADIPSGFCGSRPPMAASGSRISTPFKKTTSESRSRISNGTGRA
jgi:hypothetical protein